MRVCGIFLDAGSHKRLPIGCVPRGNWAYGLEFKVPCKSVELGLNRRDVLGWLPLGISSRSFKVAHYRHGSRFGMMALGHLYLPFASTLSTELGVVIFHAQAYIPT